MKITITVDWGITEYAQATEDEYFNAVTLQMVIDGETSSIRENFFDSAFARWKYSFNNDWDRKILTMTEDTRFFWCGEVLLDRHWGNLRREEWWIGFCEEQGIPAFSEENISSLDRHHQMIDYGNWLKQHYLDEIEPCVRLYFENKLVLLLGWIERFHQQEETSNMKKGDLVEVENWLDDGNPITGILLFTDYLEIEIIDGWDDVLASTKIEGTKGQIPYLATRLDDGRMWKTPFGTWSGKIKVLSEGGK
jgi:hypothetical protein